MLTFNPQSFLQVLQAAAYFTGGTPASYRDVASKFLSACNPALQYAELPLIDGTVSTLTYPHGLGRNPVAFVPVLHCVTLDTGSGVTPGVEMNCQVFEAISNHTVTFLCGYDSTNVYLNYAGLAGSIWGFGWNGSLVNLTSFSNF